MRRILWRISLMSVVLGSVTLGCHNKPVVEQKTPPDPLLISKKPIDGTPATVEPPLPPIIEPLPPPLPRREMPLASDPLPPVPSRPVGFQPGKDTPR